MKKLKLLPSVLMLVLCVGVLCMGIYAASPNSNQITGSITINPAGASVDIKVWAETFYGEKSEEFVITGLRSGGQTIDLADIENIEDILKLDFSSANEASKVKPCYLKIEITNNSSTKELGAYISTKEMTTEATKSDIFMSAPMTNSSAVTATSLEFYKQMGVANAQNKSDSATLILEFKANAFIENNTPISFDDYYVNVEEYEPNIDTEKVIGSQITSVGGFIKFSTTYKKDGVDTDRTIIDNTTGFYMLSGYSDILVVIPNGVNVASNAFAECWGLRRITFSNSTTLTNDGPFGHDDLECIVFPTTSTTCCGAGGTYMKSVIIPEGITHIAALAFSERLVPATTLIPKSVISIADSAFGDEHPDGGWIAMELYYAGTMEEFMKISGVSSILEKGISVVCTDGTIPTTATDLK